ncbi:MAG TPA: VWA domain-containing protein, partial [Stenomitos sp.]
MAKKAFTLNFDFDFQLLLWQGFSRTWQWVTRDPGADRRREAGVPLAEHRDRLQILARALSGLPLLVRPTTELPGTDGRHLLLPEHAQWFEDPACNLMVLKLLTIVLAEAARTGRFTAPAALDPAGLQWAREILASYPGLAEPLETYESAELWRLKRSAWDPVPEEGLLPALSYRLMPRLQGLSPEVGAPGEEPTSQSIDGSEAEAPVQEEVTRTSINKEEQEQYTLAHSFEKVETLDEYRGTARDLDGSDEMEDQLEAMRELKMTEVIRVDDAVHSVYRAELLMGDSAGDAAEAGTGGLPYDEWDPKKRSYRKDWCRVFVRPFTESRPEWYAEQLAKHGDTVHRLKKVMERALGANEQLRRQKEGPELDLNAIVENQARVHAGQSPLEELYLASRKRKRDLAVLVLLDTSLSTDAYVEQRRVLDVCKETLLVLTEVCAHFKDPLEIAAFHSHTRNQVFYHPLKTFQEPWTHVKPRIGALEPQGYTRIGPALRHATQRLLRQKAKHRVLLLLSDGKPNDYDRYEGRYGIGDIRQAIREAESHGVHVHALAVDKQARDYLPQMLGSQRFSILRHPQELPEALSRFMVKLSCR